jgi:DNA-3-methyladenine glycosylase I
LTRRGGRWSRFALDADLPRCSWARGDPLLTGYHDREWGRRASDDRALFEMLILECFQAGLSWLTILRKRTAFRVAFRDFEPGTVAAFGDADRARLLADAGIVRNRAKIEAAIGNAAAVLELERTGGSFAAYLDRMVPRPPQRLPPTATLADLPATTSTSDALSADLRGRGFRFVGSTIVYSFMQAVGLVDDHLPGCFLYAMM